MVALATLAFTAGVAAAGVVLATLAATLLTDRRFWPTGGDRGKHLLHWGSVAVFDAAALVVAALTWNSWLLGRPASLVAGVALAAAGGLVFAYSGRAMSPAETTGKRADALYTEGPYARSRNPQYVGMLVGLVGAALAANSLPFAVLAALHAAWVVLLPFAEEPWLRARFGDEFAAYCERVPRFVGRRTVRPRGDNPG